MVGLSFLLLMLAFRSVVIPLTAGLMNLVSIGAAFGVVTAVFEKGWGVSVVGLESEVAIVSFVPLMMFAILFGLSMDYEVFLMTHIKEAWERTNDNKQAVIDGVAHTGRVITSAALIMVSVFFASSSTATRRSSSSASGWAWRWRSTRRSCAACSCPR